MKIISQQQIEQSLTFPTLIPLLKQAFSEKFTMPQRQVLLLDEDNDQNKSAFALLPSWNNEVIANKMFTYFPDNDVAKGLASLYSKIMLFSRKTGEPLALVDGTSVTYWRTAAVSALASQLLSRENSERFLLFGTGNLAPYLLHAHLSVRPLKQITICARNMAKITSLIETFSALYPNVSFAANLLTSNQKEELSSLVNKADIICCATGAKTPLFKAEWLSAGTHIDCLGNHNSDARECDTQTVLKSRVFVDSRINNLAEAGELLIPISEGNFSAEDIVAELSEMCEQAQNHQQLRQNEKEITLFKSVGTAISDLVAAYAVYQANE